jgi:hypothetical protein
MNKNITGEVSPGFPAASPQGVCGRIDFDYVFEKMDKPNVSVDESQFENEDFFYLLIQEAEDAIYKMKLDAALELYQQAYELASEVETLGLDAKFGVMFHLHYYGFAEQAFRMCAELTEAAMAAENLDLLRDIWRLLPEMNVGSILILPTGTFLEPAVKLREEIEDRFPEVMDQAERSHRL